MCWVFRLLCDFARAEFVGAIGTFRLVHFISVVEFGVFSGGKTFPVRNFDFFYTIVAEMEVPDPFINCSMFCNVVGRLGYASNVFAPLRVYMPSSEILIADGSILHFLFPLSSH